MRIVRIWFNKKGMSRFISHLDLMRTMTRAIRRSKIPLWYTEGFNPHPYMTFSLPLSLGMESECESMDIKIEGEIKNEEILSLLKSSMPSGIEITAVTDPVSDPKFISFGKFEISFYDVSDKESLVALINDKLSKDELIVQKLSKKGRRKILKDINLIEYVKEYSTETEDDCVKLFVTLPAGSTTNINPSLLADEIQKSLGEEITYVILRKELYKEDMSEFR